jgi:hypothetical protein
MKETWIPKLTRMWGLLETLTRDIGGSGEEENGEGEVELAYRGLLSLWSSLYLFDHVNLNTNKFSSFDRNTTTLKLAIRCCELAHQKCLRRETKVMETHKKNQNVLSVHFGEYEKEVFPTTFCELLLYFLLAI